MNSKVKQRLKWLELYQELNNVSKVCDHYGISHSTLRKWIRRYREHGEDGLIDLSSKPNNSPRLKRNLASEQLLLELRRERKLGARRLQSELKRLHNISFSLYTIHKI